MTKKPGAFLTYFIIVVAALGYFVEDFELFERPAWLRGSGFVWLQSIHLKDRL